MFNNLFYVVVFDIETTLENAKLAILELLALDFFHPPLYHGGRRLGSFPWEHCLVFYINQNVIYAQLPIYS